MAHLPILEGERVYLREIEAFDAPDFYEYAQDPRVGPQAGWDPHTSLEVTQLTIKVFRARHIIRNRGVFAVVLKKEYVPEGRDKMIGTIELYNFSGHTKAELGYSLNPTFWGHGYATEAARLIINWGFGTLKLEEIFCESYIDNVHSQGVCNRLGFHYEGIDYDGYTTVSGEVRDVAYYILKRENW